MKKILIIIFIAFSSNVFGQDSTVNHIDRKYIMWYSPSKAKEVYGLMLNLFPKDEYTFKRFNGYPKIHGIELNINPMGILTPAMVLISSIGSETHSILVDSLDSINFKDFKIVNGLQIATMNFEPTITNGLEISLTGSFESKINGATFSLIMNKHYVVNGFTFALIGNHDTECNGIQIGLFNSCRKLKGIQIGLININPKGTSPIINWNL